jgi:hypothetical protein
MSADGFISYDALLAEIRRLSADRRSGVMFIATSDNQGGQLTLRDGLIVGVRFHRKYGLEAAHELRRVQSARFTFTRDLPETPDPRQAVSATAVWAALTSGREGNHDAHGAIETILTKALAEYLGPMAALVVREQLRDAERAGRPPADVVEALARGLDDPAGAAAFREQATAALARARRH